MSYERKVIRVELLEETTETVRKSKRRDYGRGGYKVEETVYRVIEVTPFYLLECGHWRKGRNYGSSERKHSSMSCQECWKEEQPKKDQLDMN